ncbi:MAG: hypothetical protein ACTSRG_06270 [Candidatus Helarchaeota archaeon]
MDLINLIESTPKSKPQIEATSENGITDTQRIKQLQRIIEEQRVRINKYEQSIGPKLILMIKNYLDKLNSANNEINEKENKIISLQKEISYLKDIILKLKKIWS